MLIPKSRSRVFGVGGDAVDVERALYKVAEISDNVIKGGEVEPRALSNVLGLSVARLVIEPGYVNGNQIKVAHSAGRPVASFIEGRKDWPVIIYYDKTNDYPTWTKDTITVRAWANSWPSVPVVVELFVVPKEVSYG